MIKLVALIYLALNGAVDPEPARIVNSMFTFDTVEACEEFKKSDVALRGEAGLIVSVLARLEDTPITLHELKVICEDHTPKRDA